MRKGYTFRDSNKVVIYCRVSTEEQAKVGESLSSQKRVCTEFAKRNNYDVVQTFIEEGESGRTNNRTMLKQLLSWCLDRRKNIGAVICLKEDRFCRNVGNHQALENALLSCGVKLLFVEGSNAQDSQSKLIRHIKISLAEFESDVNSERTKAGMKEAILNGRWLWHLKGYSFKVNAYNKKQLYPNEEAKYIKQIFDLAEKGIYTQLEIQSILAKSGFQISKQALSVLLRQTVYCGLLPDMYHENNGKYIKGIHEPLISEKQFFNVQKILDGKKPCSVPRLRNNPLFPLRGYIYCEKCGKRLTACEAKGKKIKVPYYQCSTKGCPRFQKKLVESKYLEFLKNINIPIEEIEIFEKCVISKFNEKTKYIQKYNKSIKADIEKLKEKKNKVIDLMADNLINTEDGRIRLEDINKEISIKEREISCDKNMPNIESCWEFSKHLLCNLDEAWQKGDLDFKQRLQGLITPVGFKFDGEIIKPIKNPQFMDIFNPNQGFSQDWGR